MIENKITVLTIVTVLFLFSACQVTNRPLPESDVGTINVMFDNFGSDANAYEALNTDVADTITVDSRNYNTDDDVLIRTDFEDVNLDGFTDKIINTGGTWNEMHDLYVWDVHSQNYIKVEYEGFEMLAWYEVYDGYIMNFIRGSSPEDSIMEKLIWNGNVLTKDFEWENLTGALNLLYRFLYDDTVIEEMLFVNLIEDEFFGYEFQLDINTNPLHIEFCRMSKDNNYYLFWLNEQVYQNGEFSHVISLDFFAVNTETKEIVSQKEGNMPHVFKFSK